MIHIIYNHIDHHELSISLQLALQEKYSLTVEVHHGLRGRNNGDYWSINDLYIFVDIHHFLWLSNWPQKYIVYNFQQLPFGRSHKFKSALHLIKNALMFWDYSQSNLEYIREYYDLAIDCHYVPFGYTLNYDSQNLVNKKNYCSDFETNKNKNTEKNFSQQSLTTEIKSLTNKNIKIGFLGYLSDRRMKLLDQIQSNCGINITVPKPPFHGQHKYNWLAEMDIMINLHKWDSDGILEASRLIPYISNKCLVISELSSDLNLVSDFEDMIVLCKVNEMSKVIKEVIEDWETWESFVEGARDKLVENYKYHNHLPNRISIDKR